MAMLASMCVNISLCRLLRDVLAEMKQESEENEEHAHAHQGQQQHGGGQQGGGGGQNELLQAVAFVVKNDAATC